MTTISQSLESRSPADDRLIATFPNMSADDVHDIVDRARIASLWWADLGWAERKKRILTFKSVLARRSAELAALVHAENGKPTDDAVLEILISIEHTHWAATHAKRVLGRRRVAPGFLSINQDPRLQYDPVGVVGVIGPWNYPVFTPIGSIVYALAAGNAVVLKPSEFTTAIGAWLVDAFCEVVPEQPVLQIVTGFGQTGAALCTSGVDKISFTGSTPTGKKVMAACADSLTPVLLECGGKDAALIDHDADLAKAADAVVFGAFSNAGQTCTAVERIYVHQDVHDEFLELLAAKSKLLQPGQGPDADYGPMTMPSQIEVVRRHVAQALQSGGRAVVGGRSSVGTRFIEPVILVDVPEDSAAVQEETFGPTITVKRVRDMNEAVDLANAVDFGLAASVFSRSRRTCESVASRLDVGMVSMNSWAMLIGVSGLPWGGTGQSGFGRIHGAEGLRQLSRSKSTVRERFTMPVALASFDRHAKVGPTMRKVYEKVHGRRKLG